MNPPNAILHELLNLAEIMLTNGAEVSRVEETQNFIYIYVPKGTTMTDQRTGYSGPVVSGNESDGDLGMIFREENE